MNKTHWIRFGIYVTCCVLMVFAVLYASPEVKSIKDGLDPARYFEIFGKKIKFGDLVDKIIPLITITAAILCEYLLDLKKGSSVTTLFKSNSTRHDLIAALVANVPHALVFFITIFTLGLVSLLLAANKWIIGLIPPGMNVFKNSVAGIGLPLTAVLFFLIMTFFDYWRHRFLHSKLLFPLHRFHHSADHLTIFTAYRGHPAELILIPIFSFLPATLLGAPGSFLVVFHSILLFHGLIVHGEKGTEWGWVGRNLIGDPLNHKIHHSTEERHFNKNLCALTPIWDKLFGTYCYDDKPFALGIADRSTYENRNYFYVLVYDLVDFFRNVGKTVLRRLTFGARTA
jgi:sterol desaturase/sphingolipid hydroxylase (fatty acid hydroxylase superfamily)